MSCQGCTSPISAGPPLPFLWSQHRVFRSHTPKKRMRSEEKWELLSSLVPKSSKSSKDDFQDPPLSRSNTGFLSCTFPPFKPWNWGNVCAKGALQWQHSHGPNEGNLQNSGFPWGRFLVSREVRHGFWQRGQPNGEARRTSPQVTIKWHKMVFADGNCHEVGLFSLFHLWEISCTDCQYDSMTILLLPESI